MVGAKDTDKSTPQRSIFFCCRRCFAATNVGLTRSIVTPESDTDAASDEEANMELRMRLNVILAVASFVFLGAVVIGMI